MREVPKTVQIALQLLKRDAGGKSAGVYGHIFGNRSCPIAKIYGVVATGCWSGLSKSNLTKLKSFGWAAEIYTGFVNWHDKEHVSVSGKRDFPNRKYILEFLGGKK